MTIKWTTWIIDLLLIGCCYGKFSYLNCPPQFLAYTKSEGLYVTSYDRKIQDITLKECQNLCSENVDLSGNKFYCRSFDYQPSANWCYMSQKAVDVFQQGSLRRTGLHLPDTDHYEKVCLEARNGVCQGDYAAFSRIPNRVMEGFAQKVYNNIETSSDCLVKCLEFGNKPSSDFQCLSVLYFYDSFDCILNSVSRFSHPVHFVVDIQNSTVDYFDNYCVGQWDSWSGWETCSVTCGLGVFTKRRRCSDRNRCMGSDRLTKPCYRRTCRETFVAIEQSRPFWAGWEDCTKTCGKGSQTRRRICTQVSQTTCRETTQRRECILQSQCPSSGIGARWGTWGNWGQCSGSCGNGFQRRNRQCASGTQCFGISTESQACFRECSFGSTSPSNGFAWSSWGQCTGGCGQKGIQTRKRNCALAASVCQRLRTLQTRICIMAPCSSGGFEGQTSSTGGGAGSQTSGGTAQLPARWGSWERWGACSSSCGGGKKARKRSCTRGSCRGSRRQQSSCNSSPCLPVWGKWSPWTDCDPPCGYGQSVRVRLCIAGACGVNQNAAKQKKECNTPCLAAWLSWESWGSCTTTCGVGIRSRIRRCGSRDKNERDRYQCDGKSKETGECENDNCPTSREATEEVEQYSVSDEEAYRRFQKCCKTKRYTPKCIKTACRYNVTLNEVVAVLYDDDGCKIEDVPTYLECATDGHDNSDCCKSKGIKNEVCLAGCRADSEDASALATDEAMDCAFNLETILTCHRKGLTDN